MVSWTDFEASIAASVPPQGISKNLQALWQSAKGNWNAAHELIQDDSSHSASWIHAYLHRKEGDFANAAYWYHKAFKPPSTETLEAEWESIAKELLHHEIT